VNSSLKQSLNAQLQKCYDLGMARAVLGWDESVFMPEQGAEGRGRQSALLGTLVHDILSSEKLGSDLQRALDFSVQELSALEKVHYGFALKQHKLARGVPSDFYNAMQQHQSLLF
jgi:carboxypeptidase Taq